MRSVSEIERVNACGCDVCIDERLIDTDLSITKGEAYKVINSLGDSSIDIFYWNDDMEHIPTDEINQLINAIGKKLKSNGIIITITPNWYNGPSESTLKFFSDAKKTLGFHFKEYKYSQVVELFKCYEIKPWLSVIGNPFQNGYIVLRRV